jgi:hypothetical protein
MTEELPEKRPNCDEILIQKHLWALERYELNFENDLKHILNSKAENENNYIKDIIEIYLIEDYNQINDDYVSINRLNPFSNRTLKDTLLERTMKFLDCYKHRPGIVKNCFKYLYEMRDSFSDPKNDFIDSIIILIKNYLESTEIQIFATEFLSKLTQQELGENTDTEILERLVDIILTSMKSFAKDEEIQTNILSILCNYYIAENVSFDRYKCIQLSLDSLVNLKDEISNKRAIIICSKLALKITNTEKQNLSSNHFFIETLTEKMQNYLQTHQNNDLIIEHTIRLIYELFYISFAQIEAKILKN